jgi:hypothetical protein
MTSRIMPSEPSDKASSEAMLASNAERDTVAQRLQLAYAEHRLTDDEFENRIQMALTARTGAELDRLTADLPAASESAADPGRTGAMSPSGARSPAPGSGACQPGLPAWSTREAGALTSAPPSSRLP